MYLRCNAIYVSFASIFNRGVIPHVWPASGPSAAIVFQGLLFPKASVRMVLEVRINYKDTLKNAVDAHRVILSDAMLGAAV
mgnify:FL=1